MMLYNLAECGPTDFLRLIYLFKKILGICFIIIPIVLIVFIIIDLMKNVISNDEKEQKKIFLL